MERGGGSAGAAEAAFLRGVDADRLRDELNALIAADMGAMTGGMDATNDGDDGDDDDGGDADDDGGAEDDREALAALQKSLRLYARIERVAEKAHAAAEKAAEATSQAATTVDLAASENSVATVATQEEDAADDVGNGSDKAVSNSLPRPAADPEAATQPEDAEGGPLADRAPEVAPDMAKASVVGEREEATAAKEDEKVSEAPLAAQSIEAADDSSPGPPEPEGRAVKQTLVLPSHSVLETLDESDVEDECKEDRERDHGGVKVPQAQEEHTEDHEEAQRDKGAELAKRRRATGDELADHEAARPPAKRRATSQESAISSSPPSSSQESVFAKELKRAAQRRASQASLQSNPFFRTPTSSQADPAPPRTPESFANRATRDASGSPHQQQLESPASSRAHMSIKSSAVDSPFVSVSQRTYRSAGENLWENVDHDDRLSSFSFNEVVERRRKARSSLHNEPRSEWLEIANLLAYRLPSLGPLYRTAFTVSAASYAAMDDATLSSVADATARQPSPVPAGVMPAVHRELGRFFAAFAPEERRRVRELCVVPGMTFAMARTLVKTYGVEIMGSAETAQSINAILEVSSLQRMGLHAALADRYSQARDPAQQAAKADTSITGEGNAARESASDDGLDVMKVDVPELWAEAYERVLVCVCRGSWTAKADLSSLESRFSLATSGPLCVRRDVGFLEERSTSGQTVEVRRMIGARFEKARGRHVVVDILIVQESGPARPLRNEAGTAQGSSTGARLTELMKLYFSSRAAGASEESRKAASSALGVLQEELQMQFPDALGTLRQFLALEGSTH